MSRRDQHLPAFTLVEILISIMILALGVLGLGALFPVVIREQRIGVESSTGIVVANSAKDLLTTPQWSRALPIIPLPVTPANTSTVYGACCQTAAPYACALSTRQACASRGGAFLGSGFACGVTPCSLIPASLGVDGATAWLWETLRDRELAATTPVFPVRDGLAQGFNPNSAASSFQPYGQGEWFTRLTDPLTGTAKLGYPNVPSLIPSGQIMPFFGAKQVVACVDLPVGLRLYPQAASIDPQFVWDYAVQRVSHFNFFEAPDADPVRAAIFVRRVDSRIRPTGTAKSILDAITNASGTVQPADMRFPVGEDANGNPTFDGTNGAGGLRYSGIHTCEVEFWYNPAIPSQNHPDRLYVPTTLVDSTITAQLPTLWAQMKQPGQKLVDNLGNIYTVIGSGQEIGIGARSISGVTGSADYLRVDPPVQVPQNRAAPATQMGATYTGNTGDIQRAIWQVSFTAQIPVSVTVVDLIRGSGQ